MYHETENAELLELLSKVEALNEDVSSEHSHQPDDLYHSEQHTTKEHQPSASTPFDKLEKFLSTSTPTSTHTTPAGTLPPPRQAHHHMDGIYTVSTPATITAAGINPLLLAKRLDDSREQQDGSGGRHADDGGHSGGEAAPPPRTYTLSQTLFSSPSSLRQAPTPGGGGQSPQTGGREGAATPPTVGKQVSPFLPTYGRGSGSGSGDGNAFSSAAMAVAAAAATTMALCPSPSPQELLLCNNNNNNSHRIGKNAMEQRPLSASPLASLAPMAHLGDKADSNTNSSDFMVVGSDSFMQTNNSINCNTTNTQTHAVYSSLAEAFSAAAGDGGTGSEVGHAYDRNGNLTQRFHPGCGSGSGSGGSPLEVPMYEGGGDRRGTRSPLLPLSSLLHLVHHPYSSNHNNANAFPQQSTTPYHQRLSQGDDRGRGDLQGSLSQERLLHSFTAAAGSAAFDEADGGNLNSHNHNHPQPTLGNGDSNRNSVLSLSASGRERGWRDEPQPSLRPRAPNSKQSTPQTYLTNRSGSTHNNNNNNCSDGTSHSATKVKLHYFTLPSPPRPLLPAGMGASGNAQPDIPRILTQEAPAAAATASAARGPQPRLRSDDQAGSRDRNSNSVFMSSIAAQLNTNSSHGTPSTYGSGFRSTSSTAFPQQQQQLQLQVPQPYSRRPHSANSISTSTNSNVNRMYYPSSSPTAGGGGGAATTVPSPIVPLLLQAATGGLAAVDDPKNARTAAATATPPHHHDAEAFIAAKILSMSRDQHGCRQLQNILTKEILAPTTAADTTTFAESMQAFEQDYARALEQAPGHHQANNNNTHNHNAKGNSNNNLRNSPFNLSGLAEADKEANYAASVIIPVVVRAAQANFALIMSDAYGNFLIQRMIEIAPQAERVRILRADTDGNSNSSNNPPHSHYHPPSSAYARQSRNSFAENIVSIACSPHGTFALQRLIETIATEEEEAFVFSAMFEGTASNNSTINAFALGQGNPQSAEERGQLMRLVTDPNGGHVLCKMTAYLKAHYYHCAGSSGSQGSGRNSNVSGRNPLSVASPAEKVFTRMRPFLVFLLDHLLYICTHRHGCCVTQKCVNFLADMFPLRSSTMPAGHPPANGAAAAAEMNSTNCFTLLAEQIVALSPRLACDPYGNYVLNHLVEVSFVKGDYTLVQDLFRHLQPRIFPYCRDKFASNVVETIVRFMPARETRLLCESLLQRITLEDVAATTAAPPPSETESQPPPPSTVGGNKRGGAGGHRQGRACQEQPSLAEHVGKTKLEVLALDPYGNYVVQTLLGLAPADLLLSVGDDGGSGSNSKEKKAATASPATGMLVELERIAPEIKEKNFGKKILTKIDLAMDRVRQQQQL